MTTLLLCSVGSRAVQISAELLPAHLRDTLCCRMLEGAR